MKTKIADKVRRARIDAGYTQPELADILNMSIPTICTIETGKKNYSIGNLEKITKFFKLDLIK